MAQKNIILWIGIGIVVILVAVGIYYFAASNGGNSAGSGAGSETSNAGTNAQAIPEYQKDSEGNIIIEIKNFAFNPAEVVLYARQSVKWINEDDTIHQLYGPVGPTREIRSQKLGKGSYYVYIFDKAGTYEYHCTYHPDMKGKIVVK